MSTAASSVSVSPLLEIMIGAATAAGEGLQEDFARCSSLEIEYKLGPDPVTAADRRAEATVRRMLSDARPE